MSGSQNLAVQFSGAFPCLAIRLVFDRKTPQDYVGHTLYISSSLLVVAAWGGFWLDGLHEMTTRLTLSLGTTAILVLELAGAATWYEEWDLMGDKTQFWLAFCGLLTTMSIVELVIVHILLGRFLAKVKGAANEPVRMNSDGEVSVFETKKNILFLFFDRKVFRGACQKNTATSIF